MDAAPIAPMQGRRRRRARKDCRHLPPEMVEEILLNLPVKSLVRFSSVCKSWNTLIWEPQFTRKHKGRAILLRRNRIVIYMSINYAIPTFSAFTSISSDLPQDGIIVETKWHRHSYDGVYVPTYSFVSKGPIERITEYFVGQFEKRPNLRALCDELWCVQVEDDLFLWNPSIQNYRKLPPSLFKSREDSIYVKEYLYGLAYDPVCDDYKILKIGRDPSVETELYSLKNNCWRKIESYSSFAQPSFHQERCEFVGERFHWIGRTKEDIRVIVSFNLSTEKYEEMALPEYFEDNNNHNDDEDQIEVSVLRGKLCVFVNYGCWFELLIMEEYGVEKSWIKKIDFRHCDEERTYKPVYYYDNGDILVTGTENWNSYVAMHLVLYKKENGEMKPKSIVSTSPRPDPPYYDGDNFLYVETLISPTALYNVND